MFHPTPSLSRALRRLALTTKNAPKDYYKGTGSGSMGQHTRFGGYMLDHSKVRTYVPPRYQESFQNLFPFVAARVPKPAKQRLADAKTGELIKDPKVDGRLFLKQWKEFVKHENLAQEERDGGAVEEDWASMKERAEKGIMSEEGGKKHSATAA